MFSVLGKVGRSAVEQLGMGCELMGKFGNVFSLICDPGVFTG